MHPVIEREATALAAPLDVFFTLAIPVNAIGAAAVAVDRRVAALLPQQPASRTPAGVTHLVGHP
jgi:hypothetical protein